jgi:hypothetical protein
LPFPVPAGPDTAFGFSHGGHETANR